ncbi:MAG: glycosyltransferase [Planctomycetota bacterium]
MPVGGAETLLVNLIRRLDPSRFQAEVVCLKEPGPLGQEIEQLIPVHSHLIGGKYDVAVLYRLAKLMVSRRVDAVITVGAGDKMFWGRLAAHLAGVPVIASALHSTGWPDGVGRLNRSLTTITDAFIAVADSHGEFLRCHERFPADKVHVIRNGVDCQRFQPDPQARKSVRDELQLPSDAPLVGIVAALRSEKNHRLFLATAAKLKASFPAAHWLIIGDGPERPSIEDACIELGVSDRVHLLGTRHDTPRLLAALDAFSLCSLNEASPVSILEALACEVPVAATDVGSISESIRDAETGFLVESQNVDAMADRVGRLLKRAEIGDRTMGQAGRELVLSTGSLDSMVAGYEKLVTKLYDERAEPHCQQATVAKVREAPRFGTLAWAKKEPRV